MKVILINPPIINEISSGLPKIVEDDSGAYPPLGLLYIAAYARLHGDHDIKVIDAPAERIGYLGIEKYVKKHMPRVVGITTTSFTLPDAIKTAHCIKKISPNIIIVVGGCHANIFPEQTAELGPVDFVVIGDGEHTFHLLLKCLEDDSDPALIPGLAYAVENQIVRTGTPELLTVTQLPYPDRSLLPAKNYYSVASRKKNMTTMITSRGCPNSCSFCISTRFSYRKRDVDDILGEIRQCIDSGIEEIYFIDSTFNFERDQVIALCQGIIKNKLDFVWSFKARVAPMDSEMLNLLRQAGCYRIQYGVESGTPEMLKSINKNITIDQVRSAFALTRQAGLETMAYFMFGFPGERDEDMHRTIELSLELDPDLCVFCIYIPGPGTTMYNDLLASSKIKKDYWLEVSRNPVAGLLPPYWEGDVSREQLEHMLKYAYRRFYLRPKYLARSILKLRSLTELSYKLMAGAKMIRDVIH